MLVIDKTQNSGAVELAVGDSFRIELAENPTTGARWQLPSPLPPALRLVEDSFSTATDAPGSGGMHHWTLAADSPGVAGLRLERKRSWENQSLETFEVTITVKAK